MPPPGVTTDHQTYRASRPGLVLHGTAFADGRHGIVGPADGLGDEKLRIRHIPARFIETANERLSRHYRRSLPLRMSAHAVNDDEECGALIAHHGHPVLVLFPVSHETDFCCFVPQNPTCGLLD